MLAIGEPQITGGDGRSFSGQVTASGGWMSVEIPMQGLLPHFALRLHHGRNCGAAKCRRSRISRKRLMPYFTSDGSGQ